MVGCSAFLLRPLCKTNIFSEAECVPADIAFRKLVLFKGLGEMKIVKCSSVATDFISGVLLSKRDT